MATQAAVRRGDAGRASGDQTGVAREGPRRALPHDNRAAMRRRTMLLCAPVFAVLAGLGAEWLDFRALRVPFLLAVGLGALATAHAAVGMRAGARNFARAALIRAAMWSAVEAVYVLLHAARREAFHADRFGPQWSQAVGLIAAHALFLGLPTGIAVALLLRAPALRQRLQRRVRAAGVEAAP